MNPLERLVAIEAIKNVKARYWFYMDTKNWAALEQVFTKDAVWDAREERDFSMGCRTENLPPLEDAIAAGDKAVTVGAHAVVSFMRSNVEQWKTFHLGGAPIIEVDDPDHGMAIWPIFDYLDNGKPWKGYGFYHEEYRH